MFSLTRYLALALLVCVCAARPAPAGPGLVERLREDEKGQGRAAVALARRAIEHSVRTRDPLPLPRDLPPLLRERSAVFVSAMIHGAPRCCMGTLVPRQATLAQEIVANACAAAAHDRRFPPLRAAELPRLRVIVSVIGDSRPIADPEGLDPVRDGLAVRGAKETGVVLPGETNDVRKMIAWGRIRAGLAAGDKAEYLRLSAVRFMEERR